MGLSQKKFVVIQVLKVRMQDSLGHLRPQLPSAIMTLLQKLAYCESDLPGVSGAWPLRKKQPSANEQCEQTPSYLHKKLRQSRRMPPSESEKVQEVFNRCSDVVH